MTGFIAVHCGAGRHSIKKYKQYNELSKKACRRAVQILKAEGSALEAVREAVKILEDDPLTNAAFGSNLTQNCKVECDASVMDGKSLLFGACGAVQTVKNPIELAYQICVDQVKKSPLVPPSFLVGEGAALYAKETGLMCVPNDSLISKKSLAKFEKYKSLIEDNLDRSQMDTVGAVCVDGNGHVAAACSSGGLILKRPGRVGQASIYGCGVWADSFDNDESVIGVSTTGCGEYLVKTQLAKEISDDLKNSSCPTKSLSNTLTDKFINSKYLKTVDRKVGGALVIHLDKSRRDGDVLWGHSSETMSVGYMHTRDAKPTCLISRLPDDFEEGEIINVGGSIFCL